MSKISTKDLLDKFKFYMRKKDLEEFNRLFEYQKTNNPGVLSKICKRDYSDGRSLLHFAALVSDSRSFIDKILGFGVEIDQFDRDGYTPISLAASLY